MACTAGGSGLVGRCARQRLGSGAPHLLVRDRVPRVRVLGPLDLFPDDRLQPLPRRAAAVGEHEEHREYSFIGHEPGLSLYSPTKSVSVIVKSRP